MINRIAFSVLALVLVGNVLAVELTDAQRAAIEARIKPLGESCLQGDSSCGAAGGPAGSSVARSGEAIYQSACMACHNSGVAGAPKFGDAAAWADRTAGGMDALYLSGINGIPGTSMMAKGGCMDCTDEEFEAAVDYLVDGGQ